MFLNAFVRTASMMLRIKPTLFFDHHPLSVLRSPANLECFSVLLILMRDGMSGQGTLLDRSDKDRICGPSTHLVFININAPVIRRCLILHCCQMGLVVHVTKTVLFDHVRKNVFAPGVFHA